jgi:hypothetical protein
MPSDIEDALHDEIDSSEDLLERTQAAVAKTVNEDLAKAMSAVISQAQGDAATTILDGLTMIAAQNAKRLAKLTTEAVQSGAAHGKRRVAIQRGSR